MGNKLSALLAPFYDYPVKKKPVCFHRQEDFSSTGESLLVGKEQRTSTMTEYSLLLDDFHAALLERRQQIKRQTTQEWYKEMVRSRFSGWTEITVAYLHSLFLLFDEAKRGALSLSDFCTLLASLGDDSSMEERKRHFSEADKDMDGRITYDEYLSLMYNFNPPRFGQLGALARLCNEVAQRMQFVDSLTVGEQLLNGLF